MRASLDGKHYRTFLALGLFSLVSFALRVSAQVNVDPDILKNATTPTKGAYHLICRETIKSKDQRDWTGVYNATFELYLNGQLVGSFAGSSLPNFRPGAGKPDDWEYSVVLATCAFPSPYQNNYYTWTRGTRAAPAHAGEPCLRLANKVPTVNVGNEPEFGPLYQLLRQNIGNGAFNYATNILLHNGSSADWRGSAGCLTIDPATADAFFSAIPDGTSGTLELDRGIEDEDAQQSYCY
jgi:hypothetical protein